MNTTRRLALLACGLACCLPISCRGTRYLAPNNPIDATGVTIEIREQLSQPQVRRLIQRYYAQQTNAAMRVEIRNRLITDLTLLIDTEYERFATRMLSVRAGVNTGLDTTAAGLALAATIVDHGATAQLLSGIGAGVLGLRTTVDKEFFYEQSTPILLAQMKKDRQAAFGTLSHGLSQSVTDYPLATAVRDLGHYYESGTLFHAFAELSKSITAGPTSPTLNAIPRLTVTEKVSGADKQLEVTFLNTALQGRDINLSATGDPKDDKTPAWTEVKTARIDSKGIATVTFDLPDGGKKFKRVVITAPTSTALIHPMK